MDIHKIINESKLN